MTRLTLLLVARLPVGGLEAFDAYETPVLPLHAASGAELELLTVRDVD